MCEALDDHEGSVSIGGRLITNSALQMTLSKMQKRKKKLASRYNHNKVQTGDQSRQDKSDDKQPKWLP